MRHHSITAGTYMYILLDECIKFVIFLTVCICMCGSAHDCGCVVDGSNAMAAL